MKKSPSTIKLNGVSLAETSSTYNLPEIYMSRTISRHEMECSREEGSCQRESNVRCPSQKSKTLPKKPKGPSIQIHSEAEA